MFQKDETVAIKRFIHEGISVAANLPYVASPGSIKSSLEKIRNAATPPRVTGDFVETVLQMKGGTGKSIPPFLKRIGLVASDGSPTELYRRFRNPATGGTAIAEAIKHGYKDLSQANEYFYKLSDKELLALIVQVTGVEAENRAAALTLSSIKTLKAFATFEVAEANEVLNDRAGSSSESGAARPNVALPRQSYQAEGKVGLNLSCTINLNLPATADQAVFNAIFRSLKEHLLSAND
jgi:hypothetical protein